MITLAIRDFILKVAESDNELAVEMLKRSLEKTSEKEIADYCRDLREYLENRPISEGRSYVLPDPQG